MGRGPWSKLGSNVKKFAKRSTPVRTGDTPNPNCPPPPDVDPVESDGVGDRDDGGLVIRSPANARVRQLIRWRDNNRARRRDGVALVDSWRLVDRLIAAGRTIDQLFVREDDRRIDSHSRVATTMTRVSSDILSRIAYGQTDWPVVAVLKSQTPPIDSIQMTAIDSIQMTSGGLILIADRIEKPGNLGAIYRTADAAGVAAVILCGGGDRSHPAAIRNSQAASLLLPTAVASQSDAADRLRYAGYRILAARVEASLPIDEVDLTGNVAIVVGNEADGLADRWQSDDIAGVHIPMVGTVDSLNVSVSAAVLMMEAARQRRHHRNH